MQWVHKEPDGTWKYDTDDLHTLLAHGLKLVKGPRGEALHLRGAAREEAEAAAPKRTIDVPYVDGAVDRVQTWTVEPNPEAVTVDARAGSRILRRGRGIGLGGRRVRVLIVMHAVVRDVVDRLQESVLGLLDESIVGGVRVAKRHAQEGQKDRTDPSVGRSRVRECGTSGHAAAH